MFMLKSNDYDQSAGICNQFGHDYTFRLSPVSSSRLLKRIWQVKFSSTSAGQLSVSTVPLSRGRLPNGRWTLNGHCTVVGWQIDSVIGEAEDVNEWIRIN